MKIVSPSVAGLSACLLLAAAAAADAQAPPDAGNLLREAERQAAPTLPAAPPPLPASPAAAPDTRPGPRVQVTAFRLTGVTLLPESELQARLASWTGRSVGYAELRRAADAIAETYRARGWLVRAYLPDQDIQGGVVQITVLEARLDDVRIDRAAGAARLSDAEATAYMTARQQRGAPVRADAIERAVGILDSLPGVSASSLLEPGDSPGASRLVVAVKDEARVTGLAQLDNAGSKASGEWRAGLGATLNGVLTALPLADQAQLYANKSRGSAYLSGNYGAAIGHDGLRGNLYASRLTYAYDLAANRYSGGAGVAGASLAYPLLRARGATLNTGLNVERKGFSNAVAGIELNDKHITLVTLTLAGDLQDGVFGGGVTQFSLALGSGQLNLGGNAADLAADQAPGGPARNGHFGKLNWSLGRLQRITSSDTLALTLAGQRASRNLDSAEKYGATGSTGVRAYSSSEPSGDDASVVSLEWRHQFSDGLGAAVFHERAHLKRDHSANASTLTPASYRLAGSGIGATFSPAGGWLVRGALAWRQGGNPARNPATGDDSDGTHRNPRLWVSLVKTF